jgi:hypothetical protein
VRRKYRWLAAIVAVGLALPAAAPAADPAMRLGFTDFATMQAGDPAQWGTELEHLKAARGTTLRLAFPWSGIETTRPSTDALATNPSFSGYEWSRLDALLKQVVGSDVEPLLEIGNAPLWWEGAERPAVSRKSFAGTWRPDPAAFGRFMTAAARRYSGTFPDPNAPGAMLPRVRLWQIWNEPNLPVELSPQWRKRASGGYDPVSPGLYRGLLSAGYDAVKLAHADNTVITAGTAPYGEPWVGGTRMPPALFLRHLVCVDGRAIMVAHNCRTTPAKFDVLAHHPYPIGPPGRKAINLDDVVVPDFAKLTKPLKLAIKAGNVYPATQKPIWATEISWDSSPPDPGGLSAIEQARYLAGAVYVLWRQGVSAMIWWNLRDDAPGRGYRYTLQSGVFQRGLTVAQDIPKPSLTAFRFPFAAYRQYVNFRGRGSAKLWGMAPAPGPVTLQRQASNGKWMGMGSVRAADDHVFQKRVNLGRGVRLRAVQNGEVSIDTKVF